MIRRPVSGYCYINGNIWLVQKKTAKERFLNILPQQYRFNQLDPLYQDIKVIYVLLISVAKILDQR